MYFYILCFHTVGIMQCNSLPGKIRSLNDLICTERSHGHKLNEHCQLTVKRIFYRATLR